VNRIGRRFALKVSVVASVGERSGVRATTRVAGLKVILRRDALALGEGREDPITAAKE
jgi:hypothetical protein